VRGLRRRLRHGGLSFRVYMETAGVGILTYQGKALLPHLR
jgi:hypothetical protein